MAPLVVFSPAKINLFLAITGRRADGFHDLVSLVAPLEFGDTLSIELIDGPGFVLECDQPELACDETNLVLRAARAFREASGWKRGVRFFLSKRIPLGAGLGGGSSNATSTLRGLNTLAGNPLSTATLLSVAADLGSDCPLFFHDEPILMRGRGEKLEKLPSAAVERLKGRRLLVFKPWFGVNTGWAYRQMVAGAPGSYLPHEKAEVQLASWLDAPTRPAEDLLYNNMGPVAFAKYIALQTLLDQLRNRFGLTAAMSGSGSACFTFLRGDSQADEIVAHIRAAWGVSALALETRIG